MENMPCGKIWQYRAAGNFGMIVTIQKVERKTLYEKEMAGIGIVP